MLEDFPYLYYNAAISSPLKRLGLGANPISIYSSILGQMAMGIDGHRLKNSYNLSYDENKNHHRVIRPLISKYLAIFKLNRVWYQEDSVF